MKATQCTLPSYCPTCLRKPKFSASGEERTRTPYKTWGTNDAQESAGPGQLPGPVAAKMERHFGTSFTGVKIHADERAGKDALERGAAAFTQGEHVYFGRGWYRPSTLAGQHLLAHELAHVVQQRNGRVGHGSEPASANTQRLEDEADRAANAAVQGGGTISAARVSSRADFGNPQHSLIGDIADLRAALAGGTRSAADWVVAHSTDDPIVSDMGRLMNEVSASPRLRLPRDVIASMERTLAWARSVAPSWLPIPDIRFHGDGTLGVALVDDVAIGTVILFIAILLLLYWLLLRLDPATRRAQDRAVEEVLRGIREGLRHRPAPSPDPEEAPEPEPRPRPRPDDRPPLPIPRCAFPTGLTILDPIPIAWHKIPSLYPSPIELVGHQYHRDDPTTLPGGEPIGVSSRFWPSIGKIVQLAQDRRGSAARDLRAVLGSYGFDWVSRRYLQADHAQDLQWAAPDGENLDVFNNLWPYDGAGNASAGATQNQTQSVTFCESPTGPANINVPIQSAKRPNGWGRYFVITRIGLP